jgi:hypothetical protein
MSKDRNTYAKRQRETGKRLKAEDKRARRVKRKENATSIGDSNAGDPPPGEQPLAQESIDHE